MQVNSGVTCLEHGKQAGILLGVWMVHIAELKVNLKASMTLISSNLEPNLMLMNAPISATMFSPTMDLARERCCLSLAMEVLSVFNHLLRYGYLP